MIEVSMLDGAGLGHACFSVALPEGRGLFDYSQSADSRLMQVPHTKKVVKVTVTVESMGELA